MVELDQFKVKIGNYEEPLSELKESLGLDMKQERIDQLEAQMEEPNFWDDVTSSQFVMKELKQLKSVVESYETLEAERDDILTMIEMGYEEDEVAFATPTGKAAQVLMSMGNKNVSTIHKLLYEWFPQKDGTFYRKRKSFSKTRLGHAQRSTA